MYCYKVTTYTKPLNFITKCLVFLNILDYKEKFNTYFSDNCFDKNDIITTGKTDLKII